MKRSEFNIHWSSLVMGLLLGIFGVIFTLFSRSDRRDKIHSSLLGLGLGMALTMVFFRYLL